MKNSLTIKQKIEDTGLDHNLLVPVTEILRLAEIVAFNHADSIGLDHKTMQEKSNAFWVVSKIKVFLKDNITQNEKVTLKTWTATPSMIRCDRFISIKSAGKVKAKIVSEWCCLDYTTRKIRKISSINYPNLEMADSSIIAPNYSNLKLDVDKNDYCYTRVVRSTDIDVNLHTNNLKYNFMALDAFTIEELNGVDFKEYEIYFVNESHLGDNIDIYKRKYKNYYYVEGKVQDKTIFRVVVKFKRK